MKIDFSHLRELAQQDIDEANSRSNDRPQYPIVYPGVNGRLTVKLLFNVKSNSLQRKVFRHGKVPCFNGMYSEGCPVCDAIKSAETIAGKEAGARGKYGYKVRGICYAQIVDFDRAYFTEERDPKKGDIVLLMYPKTVFEGISNIVVNSGDNLNKLVGENEGLAITIERTQKDRSAPNYSVYVYPYGSFKSCADEDNKSGDERFDELLDSLPDLNETLVPKYPNEEVRESARAMSETIISEYMGDNVIRNPNADDGKLEKEVADKVAQEEKKESPNIVDNSPQLNNQSAQQSNGDKPECYGCHSDTDKKCLLCPEEASCLVDSE